MYFYTELMERFSRMNFQKEFEPLNYFIIFIPKLYNKISLKMIIKYILYDFNYPFVIQEELRSLGTSIWIYVIAVSSLRKPALCIVQLPPSSSLKSRPPPLLRSSPSSTSVSSIHGDIRRFHKLPRCTESFPPRKQLLKNRKLLLFI